MNERTAWQALSRKAFIYLTATCLSLSVALASAGKTETCITQGDKLVDAEKWTAAVDAYRQCSKSHGDQGLIAAWSMRKAYHVLYWHLEDKHAAGAACEAGWKADNAPELGAPIWPSSNVTAVVTSQQLPRTVVDLVKTHRQTSWVNLADVIAATQSPDSLTTGLQTLEQVCQSQKYLVVDDISTVSGLGFSMITMVPISLQALVQGRILVHASSFMQGAKWSWCQEPPHSVDCYYRPWTSCIPYLRSLLMTQEDMWDLPSWKGNNASAPMTAWSQHGPHADTRDSAFYWGNPHFLQPGAASTLWWYSLFMRQYFSPSPAMEAEAVDFLRSSGLQPWDSFIVINVRHGSKGTEQEVIQPEEFIQPLKQMSACLGTRHVYLVTETKAVAERMLALGKQHGFDIFTVEYNYPGVDIWNPDIMGAQGKNISQAGLREIGYVSAKVLAVTRLGTGFIGTLQSAWAKVSVAAMYGYHGRPVPTLTLRPTWALEKGYVGWDWGWLSHNGSLGYTQPWPCI